MPQRVADRHQIAERGVAIHVGIAGAPGGPVFRVQPDDPFRSLRQASDDVGPRVGAVAACVAEDDHGGFVGHVIHPAVLEIGKRIAVVRGPEADQRHDFGDGFLDRFLLQDLRHFDQGAGEGEGADVGQRLIDRVHKHQQELRHRGDRSGDVAQHHHPRLFDAFLFPDRDERDAAPAHVPPQRAPRVELPAQTPPPGLRIPSGEFFRHLPHQDAHPVEIASFQVGQACGFQQFLSELFGVALGEQQQVPFHEVADGVTQHLHLAVEELCSSQSLRRPGLSHRLDVAFQRAQAHAVEDTAGVQVFLCEEPDVFDAGLARRLLHCRCQGGTVVVCQQRSERLATLPAHAVAAGAVGRAGEWVLVGCFGIGFVAAAGEFVTLEIKVEDFVVGGFFVRCLGQHQA